MDPVSLQAMEVSAVMAQAGASKVIFLKILHSSQNIVHVTINSSFFLRKKLRK